MSETETPNADFATVLAAYLSKNEVAPADLPAVTAAIRAAVNAGPTEAGRDAPRQLTVKEIRDAVQPDSILCFENGKRYVQMKRPLTTMGLTPAEYRRKWGLPIDHPMVAPNYSKQRSELAKSRGFGRKPTA